MGFDILSKITYLLFILSSREDVNPNNFPSEKSHFKKDAFAPTVSLQGRRFREGPGEVIFPINPTFNFLQYSGRVFSIRITFDSFLSGTTFLDAL